MYFYDYVWFMIAILICTVFSVYASSKVNRTYQKFGSVYNRSGMSGYDTASRLLRANGVNDITVGHVSGTLSDHYHPAKGVVNLSDSTYDSRSVASAAVAAHEIGHVMQKQTGYGLYRLRTALVPVVNFGSRLAMPLVLVGLLLDFATVATQNSNLGFYIAMIGVLLYGGSFLFALVTLPVELDASRRAKKMLFSEGILREEEMPGAEKVLSAAAMTYLASLSVTLVYFLRFLFYVLTIFGRRNKR